MTLKMMASPETSRGPEVDCPTALIVVEERLLRLEILDGLQSAGFGVSSTSSIADARMELRCHQPDVVALDPCMRDGEGVEVLEICQDLHHRPKLLLVSELEEGLLASASTTAACLGCEVIGALNKTSVRRDIEEIAAELVNRESTVRAQSVEYVQTTSLEADFQYILDNNFLGAFLQPKHSLDTGRLTGFEALARIWNPQKGSFQPPGLFVELMDQPDIGRQVFARVAYSVLDAISKKGSTFQGDVSINAPKVLFSQEATLSFLARCADEFGVDRSRLTLEITETGNVHLTPAQRLGLLRARMMGFGLSLDDFGVGSASVERILQLPLTEVKLDASLVWAAAKGDNSLQNLLKTIASVCADRRLNTVAEGIETWSMLTMVRDAGFTLGQGRLFSMPIPQDQALSDHYLRRTSIARWTA